MHPVPRLKSLDLRDLTFEASCKLAYWLWGEKTNPAVFCVHALTRNGRDFDFLARELQQDFHFICPDLPGRGKSDWLSDTGQYNYDVYASYLLQLMDARGIESTAWVGSSLGGILGMRMAAEQPQRVHKLLLNDIGAVIPVAGLKRINRYVGMSTQFSTRESAEKNLREVYAGFAIKEEQHWQHMLEHSFNQLSNGEYQLAYDPGILDAVRSSTKKLAIEEDVLLWDWWDKIACPVMILRGEDSDILTAEVAEEMLTRNPNATLVTFPNVGHAPSLMSEDQIAIVRDWLKA
jgi:pimeloyl-ACP methyl ester carboxylesterase